MKIFMMTPRWEKDLRLQILIMYERGWEQRIISASWRVGARSSAQPSSRRYDLEMEGKGKEEKQ